MNEDLWRKNKRLKQLLTYLRLTHKVARTKVGRRKLRLFAGACSRLVWDIPGDEQYRRLVEAGDAVADGLMTNQELAARQAACRLPVQRLPNDPAYHAALAMYESANVSLRYARRCAVCAMLAMPTNVRVSERRARELKTRRCREVLHDIFGNPFSAMKIDPAWLGWNNGTVVEMAKTIYAERQFDYMPILGDALEDAGCNNAEILAHCRQPGVHTRGCWVVDRLGRTWFRVPAPE